MTESDLLFYLSILTFFSVLLGMKVGYIILCVKTGRFTTSAKIYAGTMLVTLWMIYITWEAIIEVVAQ